MKTLSQYIKEGKFSGDFKYPQLQFSKWVENAKQSGEYEIKNDGTNIVIYKDGEQIGIYNTEQQILSCNDENIFMNK